MVHNLTKTYKWTFREYDHEEKSTKWMAAFLVAILAGSLIAILLSNNLLAGIIIIGGTLLFYLSRREPDEVTLEISERGIKQNEQLYPYEQIEAFWITDSEPTKQTHLLLLTNRNLFPLLSVPLPDGIDVINLRKFLQNFIEEQELKEPWIYDLVDHLGL